MTGYSPGLRSTLGKAFIMFLRDTRRGRKRSVVGVKNIQGYLGSVKKEFANRGLDAPFTLQVDGEKYLGPIWDLLRELRKRDGAVSHKQPLNTAVIKEVTAMATPISLESDMKLRIQSRTAFLILGSCSMAWRGCECVGEETEREDGMELGVSLGDISLYDSANKLLVDRGKVADSHARTTSTLEEQLLEHARSGSVIYRHQKNGENGEVITYPRHPAYGKPGSLDLCAVRALVGIVAQMTESGATTRDPICLVRDGKGGEKRIDNGKFVAVMREAAGNVPRGELSVEPKSFTGHSGRTTFAVLLTNQGRKIELVKVFGRWKSDAVMNYVKVIGLTSLGPKVTDPGEEGLLLEDAGNFRQVPVPRDPGSRRVEPPQKRQRKQAAPYRPLLVTEIIDWRFAKSKIEIQARFTGDQVEKEWESDVKWKHLDYAKHKGGPLLAAFLTSQAFPATSKSTWSKPQKDAVDNLRSWGDSFILDMVQEFD
ncbi:hypothetical protein TrRE_jg642 [Triparma retinervis]|uniref:Uncharacterized protein n=1 Tax=Triparma retinervis TaxID=2557542 RepID=A0A9W7A748_9STRA|nr:hypothetical protein TrRE_jg642 [Triparma retinervis]